MINKKSYLKLLLFNGLSCFAGDQDLKKTWLKIVNEFEGRGVDERLAKDFEIIFQELTQEPKVGFVPIVKTGTKSSLLSRFGWEVVD